MSKTSNILITLPSTDYELLDSGNGEKLERFGKIILSRPDPQALWDKRLSVVEWKKADANFVREESQGSWNLKSGTIERWPIELGGLKFLVKPTAFKHVGLFPEQSVNWEWLEMQIEEGRKKNEEYDKEQVKEIFGKILPTSNSILPAPELEVLNLFGYTGGATLACAKAGAKVVHVDGSKAAIAWARENAELSGLEKKPVRWILDDARAFVSREIKRGRLYDGIIMDPPAFGHGPDNELWKIEENFLPLVEDCFKILKGWDRAKDNMENNNSAVDNDGAILCPSFFIINGYSAGYSAVAYENILLPLKEKFGGEIEIGELTIQEAGNREKEEESGEKGEGESQRLLPCGIFARWSRE